MLKGVQQWLSLVALLCVATFSIAGDLNKAAVDLILPADTPHLRSLANSIRDRADFSVNTYIGQPPPAKQAGDVLLVISDELLPLLNNPHYRARFALYTNSARFANYHNATTSAVYADQPLSRQLQLIDVLLGKRHTDIAMVWKNPSYLAQYQALQNDYPDYQFKNQQASASNPERQINRLIQHSKVLLATPETELYNANSIRSILLAAYRHQTLVIGPDQAFVTAGALASVSSEPEHYVADIVDSIQHYFDTSEIPPPRYPATFNVTINHHVADSLGIPVGSDADVLRRMREN